jgi:hypothetical protein
MTDTVKTDAAKIVIISYMKNLLENIYIGIRMILVVITFPLYLAWLLIQLLFRKIPKDLYPLIFDDPEFWE